MGSDESHFNVSVGSDGQSHKTVSTNHNLFWWERRAEALSNRGPSAYQPNALPLGHTGSHLEMFCCGEVCCWCCYSIVCLFVLRGLCLSLKNLQGLDSQHSAYITLFLTFGSSKGRKLTHFLFVQNYRGSFLRQRVCEIFQSLLTLCCV